jgi:DNA (cytosine-5)-methyltransferase 1
MSQRNIYKDKMKHGSLFSGIGGFDYAAEQMGWENLFHCEWNEFGQRVLKHYWPQAKLYNDITKSDFTIWRGKIDIITGGFPCQPYSQAGKRLGKEDDRHLWPEMLRAIREIQPTWVVGENVFGLVNWNGGLVFHEVQADLEAEGYEVQPYVLPAVSVNAPHRRDRVWFVAYAKSNGGSRTPRGASGEVGRQDGRETQQLIKRCKIRTTPNPNRLRCGGRTKATRHDNSIEKRKLVSDIGHNGNEVRGEVAGCGADDTNTTNQRLQGSEVNGGTTTSRSQRNEQFTRFFSPNWQNFPTQSPICGGDDGLPTELDGITFPKWRNESIKAYGNAIVPQVALQIFRAIQQYEDTTRIK